MKFSARVKLPVTLKLDGGEFIQFAGTIATITGDNHAGVEDGPDGYFATFVVEAPSDAVALDDARACVRSAMKRIGLHDMEVGAASVEPLAD